MGWLVGFEPTHERVTVVCVNRFTTATITRFGAPERIRTSDLRIRSPLLYPAELQAQRLVGVRGFEPPTPCSQGRCASQAALHPEKNVFIAYRPKSCKHFYHRRTSGKTGWRPTHDPARACRKSFSSLSARPRWLMRFFSAN